MVVPAFTLLHLEPNVKQLREMRFSQYLQGFDDECHDPSHLGLRFRLHGYSALNPKRNCIYICTSRHDLNHAMT